jgi:hypothetical protein
MQTGDWNILCNETSYEMKSYKKKKKNIQMYLTDVGWGEVT